MSRRTDDCCAETLYHSSDRVWDQRAQEDTPAYHCHSFANCEMSRSYMDLRVTSLRTPRGAHRVFAPVIPDPYAPCCPFLTVCRRP